MEKVNYEAISEIDKLEKEKSKIQDKIYKIKNTELEETQYPRIKAMVGLCFKSSYITRGEIYHSKILECVENKEWGLYFIIERIKINKQGDASIGISSESPYTNKEWWEAEIPIHGIEKIDEVEYEKARVKVVEEMSNRTKLRKFLIKRK